MATTSIGAPGVVFPDATTQASAANPNVITRIYQSPSPWTKPATLKAVRVTLVAGGGGGSGARPGNAAAGGNGGNGGVLWGYAQAPTIPGPLTVTVGALGAGGTSGAVPSGIGSPGGTGGTSSFGAVFSTTGGGGGAYPGTNGASGGSFAITPTSLQITSPIGANISPFGIPTTVNTGGVGNSAVGYGAGGAAGTGPGTPNAGGSGTAGFVIVEEFY